MRKLFLCFLLLALLYSFLPVTAEDVPELTVNEEMLEILDVNLENLFPIISIREYFNTPAEALYSDVGDSTAVQTRNVRGVRQIRLLANADHVHDHLTFDAIDDAYFTDFQMTMDVTINDAWPEQQGGCFVGFTNYGVSAFHGVDGAETVALLTDGKNTEIYVKDSDLPAGEHHTLNNTRGKTALKLSIIHLTGHTYVYIDDVFAGQFHDGQQGPFRLLYGAALFTEGESAYCTFDNLVVRKLGYQ